MFMDNVHITVLNILIFFKNSNLMLLCKHKAKPIMVCGKNLKIKNYIYIIN